MSITIIAKKSITEKRKEQLLHENIIIKNAKQKNDLKGGRKNE
jgi:hypothetical protein